MRSPQAILRWAMSTGLLLLAVAGSGCFGLYEAHVPDEHLPEGWSQVDSGGGGSWLGDGARWSHRTYEVEQGDPTGPYAAYLTVLSIDTLMQLDREKVSSDVDQQIREDAQAQNVQIDDASRRTGERELRSGVKTLWFTYKGEAQGGGLFRSGNEVRIVGEVWPDERSKITVVSVGLAQVEGGNVFTYEDLTRWHAIIKDPQGNIDPAARGDDGLVYNVRSHD